MHNRHFLQHHVPASLQSCIPAGSPTNTPSSQAASLSGFVGQRWSQCGCQVMDVFASFIVSVTSASSATWEQMSGDRTFFVLGRLHLYVRV